MDNRHMPQGLNIGSFLYRHTSSWLRAFVVFLLLVPTGARADCPPLSNGVAALPRFNASGSASIYTEATTTATAVTAGALVYDTAGGFLKLCDGTSWTTLTNISPWATNGSNIYYNTGNIGIGSSSPTSKLFMSDTYYGAALNIGSYMTGIAIVGSANDMIGLTVWDRDGSSSTNDDGDATLYWGDNANDSLRFAFSSSSALVEKMRVTSSGQLAIGTTTPQATLDVGGYARLKKYTAAPVACSTTYDGSLALTSATRLCVCNGTGWVEVNSATSCTW